MRAWNACRFCKRNDEDEALVKYGVRHYAHGPCLVQHRGIEAIARLRAWQIAALPALRMAKAGVSFDTLTALHDAAVAREARKASVPS